MGERNERQRVKRIPEEGAQRPTKLYCVVRRSIYWRIYIGPSPGMARVNSHNPIVSLYYILELITIFNI